MKLFRPYLHIISLLILTLFSTAFSKEVIDQLNRKVTVPDSIERAVVLQHQTLNLMVQLGVADKIVGILSSWEKQLGKNYNRLAPNLKSLAMPGDLTTVNIESLMALNPQVVFVTNYMPEDIIKQMEALKIPVVAISLRKDAESEANKINPKMVDEEYSYNEGLKEGIRLIGNVMNKQSEAEELINYAFSKRALVSDRLKSIKPEDKIAVYMANPDLTTYGSGKYTGLMMDHAGARNVAASTIEGYKQVSMEHVLNWNPKVIFVQERYPSVVDEILKDPKWQPIDAVKNHQVFLMPEYAKAWGYPMPEAIAIGELWMAKKLYPALFEDIDMNKEENAYYEKFYRMPYLPQ